MLDAGKIKTIQQDIEKALREVADRHGLVMSNSKIVFSDVDFKLTTTFGDKTVMGGDVDPEFVRNLKRNGSMYGLTLSHVGTHVSIGSRMNLRFEGLRGKKAALRSQDGRVWLYDAMVVAQLIRNTK